MNTLVSVGGDKVNSVTADLLQGSAVDWTAETKVVREVVRGSKIVVAGKVAADTLDAAKAAVEQHGKPKETSTTPTTTVKTVPLNSTELDRRKAGAA